MAYFLYAKEEREAIYTLKKYKQSRQDAWIMFGRSVNQFICAQKIHFIHYICWIDIVHYQSWNIKIFLRSFSNQKRHIPTMYSLNYISQRVCYIYNFELSDTIWFHDNFDPIYKLQEVIINTPYAAFS